MKVSKVDIRISKRRPTSSPHDSENDSKKQLVRLRLQFIAISQYLDKIDWFDMGAVHRLTTLIDKIPDFRALGSDTIPPRILQSYSLLMRKMKALLEEISHTFSDDFSWTGDVAHKVLQIYRIEATQSIIMKFLSKLCVAGIQTIILKQCRQAWCAFEDTYVAIQEIIQSRCPQYLLLAKARNIIKSPSNNDIEQFFSMFIYQVYHQLIIYATYLENKPASINGSHFRINARNNIAFFDSCFEMVNIYCGIASLPRVKNYFSEKVVEPYNSYFKHTNGLIEKINSRLPRGNRIRKIVEINVKKQQDAEAINDRIEKFEKNIREQFPRKLADTNDFLAAIHALCCNTNNIAELAEIDKYKERTKAVDDDTKVEDITRLIKELKQLKQLIRRKVENFSDLKLLTAFNTIDTLIETLEKKRVHSELNRSRKRREKYLSNASDTRLKFKPVLKSNRLAHDSNDTSQPLSEGLSKRQTTDVSSADEATLQVFLATMEMKVRQKYSPHVILDDYKRQLKPLLQDISTPSNLLLKLFQHYRIKLWFMLPSHYDEKLTFVQSAYLSELESLTTAVLKAKIFKKGTDAYFDWTYAQIHCSILRASCTASPLDFFPNHQQGIKVYSSVRSALQALLPTYDDSSHRHQSATELLQYVEERVKMLCADMSKTVEQCLRYIKHGAKKSPSIEKINRANDIIEQYESLRKEYFPGNENSLQTIKKRVKKWIRNTKRTRKSKPVSNKKKAASIRTNTSLHVIRSTAQQIVDTNNTSQVDEKKEKLRGPLCKQYNWVLPLAMMHIANESKQNGQYIHKQYAWYRLIQEFFSNRQCLLEQYPTLRNMYGGLSNIQEYYKRVVNRNTTQTTVRLHPLESITEAICRIKETLAQGVTRLEYSMHEAIKQLTLFDYMPNNESIALRLFIEKLKIVFPNIGDDTITIYGSHPSRKSLPHLYPDESNRQSDIDLHIELPPDSLANYDFNEKRQQLYTALDIKASEMTSSQSHCSDDKKCRCWTKIPHKGNKYDLTISTHDYKPMPCLTTQVMCNGKGEFDNHADLSEEKGQYTIDLHPDYIKCHTDLKRIEFVLRLISKHMKAMSKKSNQGIAINFSDTLKGYLGRIFFDPYYAHMLASTAKENRWIGCNYKVLVHNLRDDIIEEYKVTFCEDINGEVSLKKEICANVVQDSTQRYPSTKLRA